MSRIILTFCSLILIGGLSADELDSTFVPIDSAEIIIDSTLPTDSTDVLPDTLTETQRAYQHYLDRQQQRQQELVAEIKARVPYFSFYDSLLTYFTISTLDQRAAVEKSFARDAGDYFRYNSSYFPVDFQQTPLRKTIQPFGLSGNRINIIHNGNVISPFEHVIEPTGLIDFNDAPSSLDDQIYLLPGGAGQLFGGKQSIATLLTVPNRPDSITPESYFKVDKGPFDYSYTRGKYSKRFLSGREIDFSTEYRSTSGIRQSTDDNSYQYTGRALFPINESYTIKVSGNTMRRAGSYIVADSDISSSRSIRRYRTDRSANLAIEKLNQAKTIKYNLSYLHKKQNSNLDGNYKGRFNTFNDGLQVGRESVHGNFLMKMESSYQLEKFRDGFDDYKRDVFHSGITFIQAKQGGRFAVTVGTDYVEDYKLLPFSSFLYIIKSDKALFMFSTGYSERPPSLYELHLKTQEQAIYSGTIDYADQGYRWLGSEKQLVGSVVTQLGTAENNISLSITGGKIKDGIDWHQKDTILTLNEVRLFYPTNGDITFTDFSIQNSFSLLNYFQISSGGAYHYIDYSTFENKAYNPEYQLFIGGEFHYFWKQKWMDLFAYGEIVFTGPYTGYSGEALGETAVVNTGLSFSIKDFRFHYIFQNSLQQFFQNHEDLDVVGRFQYYGFTWNFFD